MNIDDILSVYHAANEAFLSAQNAHVAAEEGAENSFNTWMWCFLIPGSVIGLIIGLWLGIRDRSERIFFSIMGPLVGGLFFMIVGFITGSILFYAPPSENEPHNGNQEAVAAAQISERVADQYGIKLSEERALEALRADDDQVTTFSAQHDGAQKSLGLTIDEEAGKLFVFDGEKALTPTLTPASK